MSIRANVGRSGEHNAVQRPEKPNFIREAVAFVDAADQPLAAKTCAARRSAICSAYAALHGEPWLLATAPVRARPSIGDRASSAPCSRCTACRRP